MGENLKKTSIVCFAVMVIALVLFILAGLAGYSEIFWRLLLLAAGISFIIGIVCYGRYKEKK